MLEARPRAAGSSLAALVTEIDTARADTAHPLASALRLQALAEAQRALITAYLFIIRHFLHRNARE